jgi:hypothetical protein
MSFVMTLQWKVVQSKFSYFWAMVRNIRLSRLSSSRLWYILTWYQHFGEIYCSQLQKSTFKATTLNTDVTGFTEMSVIYRICGLRHNRFFTVTAVRISHLKSYIVYITLPLKYIRPVEWGFALFYSSVERWILINSLKKVTAAPFFNLALLPLSVSFLGIF